MWNTPFNFDTQNNLAKLICEIRNKMFYTAIFFSAIYYNIDTSCDFDFIC